MVKRVLLVGLGDLGNRLLQLLSQEPGIETVLVASRNTQRGEAACNLARFGASAMGWFPEIRFVSLDLREVGRLADLVTRENPDLVVHTATKLTWWLTELLPAEQAKRIKSAGFGVWLPVHLALSLKLVEALARASFNGFIVTAPFPDVVNCVLGRLGLPPTCGVGNLDELIPRIQYAASLRLGVPQTALRIWLVGHHSLESAVLSGNRSRHPPYHLRIECDDRLTGQVDEVLWESWPIPPGRAIHFLTAASAIRIIRALSGSKKTLIHVPGPLGLPGGYPVLASAEGLEFCEIPGISMEEAVQINECSHRWDGIERIEPDGTVYFCAASIEVMEKELGYRCEKLEPGESESRAEELIAKFRDYARRHGVHEWWHVSV